MIEIKELPFVELEASPGFKELVAEYTEETANPEIGIPNPMFNRYRRLNKKRQLVCIGMYETKLGVLIGLAGVRFSLSQHYDFPIATIESLYLRKSFRKGTTGLRLVKYVKKVVKEAGAPGIVFMAPPGSRYDQFCEKCRMEHTHNAWWAKV